jgi:hypothetical protein
MLSLLSVATWLAAANPHLDEGRVLYEAQLYERAAEKLREAIQVPDLSAEERIEGYDLLARSLAALKRMDEAKATYSALLVMEPHAPFPKDAAPKIRDAFTQAKRELYRREYVELELLPAPAGWLKVRIIDPWEQVKEVRMQARGPAGFQPLTLTRDGMAASGELPAPGEDGTAALYLEALAASDGHVTARLGSPEQPLVFRGVPRAVLPSARPEAREHLSPGRGARWGGWALAGASVLAATVGTVLAVQASQDSRAADRAPWASETRTLDSRARRKALQSHLLIGGALAGGAGAVVLLATF